MDGAIFLTHLNLYSAQVVCSDPLYLLTCSLPPMKTYIWTLVPYAAFSGLLAKPICGLFGNTCEIWSATLSLTYRWQLFSFSHRFAQGLSRIHLSNFIKSHTQTLVQSRSVRLKHTTRKLILVVYRPV